MIDGLPFDPRQTGPIDVARAASDRAKAFGEEYGKYLIGSATALIIAGWYLEVSVPVPGTWFWVGVLSSLLAIPPTLYIGWKLSDELYAPETETLSIQNPQSGNQQIKHVSPAVFEGIQFWNAPPEEDDASPVDRSYIEQVRINGLETWEIDEYRPEEGIAIASSMAGRSNSDIRRDRHEIAAIKYDLITEAEKATQFLVEAHGILRKQGEEVAHELVRIVEDVDLPQGGELHDRLWQARNDADPTDDLLDSNYDFDPEEYDKERQDRMENGEEDDAADSMTIHERAEAMGVATDGGER